MTINTILFDVDGTLLDTNNLIIQSFQHTYRTIFNEEKNIDHIIKSFGEPLGKTMLREFKDAPEEALRVYREFQFNNFEKLLTIHTGVKETVLKLYEDGYKLGVVTSRLKSSAIRGLNKFKLTDCFGCIIGADSTEKHKPHPEPIYMALEQLSSRSKETIMVGDSAFDVLCAKNAQVTSVIVGWSALPKETYMQHNPDFIIDNMEDIYNILNRGDNR